MNLLQQILLLARSIGLLLTLILVSHTPSISAEPNIYYSVKPNRGDINTDFYVQVSISGNDFTNSSQPTFEETEEMLLQYVSSSVQQQMINGDVSFQKSFNYKIVFKKILPSGEHKLPRGAVFLNGTKHRLPTKSISIEAGNSSKNPNGNPDPRAPQSNDLNVSSRDGFQFVQTVSNENPYIGEQILYRVEIIAPDNLQKAELEEFEPQGVWRERYGSEEKKVRNTHNLSIHSFSESWFPIQAGELEVPTRILHAEVREFQKKKRSGFGSGSSFSEQFLGSLLQNLNQFKSVEKFIKAPAFKVSVKPLPPPPNEVTGFIPVGQIKVSSTLSSESTNIGEPVTLTIQVSGDANLRPLEIKSPEGIKNSELKRYDDKPILSRTIGESNVTFYKTFKIALIPLKSGYINVPSFEVQWFNPVTKNYEKYSTQPTALRVLGTEAGNTEASISTEAPNRKNDNTIEDPKFQSKTPEVTEIIDRHSVFTFNRTTSIYLSAFTILLMLMQIIFLGLKKKLNNKKYRDMIQAKRLKAEIRNDLANNALASVVVDKVKSLIAIKIDKDVSYMTSEELLNAAKTKIADTTLLALKNLIIEIEVNSFSGEKSENSIILGKIAKVIDSI